MRIMTQILKIGVCLGLLFLPCIEGSCPNGARISPCQCYEETHSLRVFCQLLTLPQLTTTLKEAFCGLTIGQLYLSRPNITYLPSNLFIRNIVHDFRIEDANISHFTQAGRSAFFGQEKHIEVLSMRRCNLDKGLRWDMLAELRALHYLDLSFNSLKAIQKDWFYHPPPNLRSLILKENQIDYLDSGVFRHLHKLNELDLSSNKIKIITRDMFPFPGNELTFLRLSDNDLSSLPEDLFVEMFGLRRLYLDNNKLTNLDDGVWRPIWGELERLELYGNPLECCHDMKWIMKLKLPQMLYGRCNIPRFKQANNHTEWKNYTEIVELRKLQEEDFLC